MRRIFIASVLLATCLASCIERKTENGKVGIDTLIFNKKDTNANIGLKVEFPVTDNKVLENAITEFIIEELGGTYNDDLINGNAIIKYYGNTLYNEITNEAKEFGDEYNPSLEYSQSIIKIHETKLYVTYIADTYVFMGGAHGTSTKAGCTFRKNDGRRFSYNMLHNTERAEFKQMIKQGLRKYFANLGTEITDDETLASMLITESDVNYLPLPESEPYLTDQGVVFIYQQYEIAPYAAGMPKFTISYRDIMPYLTTTALNYINN